MICESDVVHKSLFFIAVPGDKLNVLLKYSLNYLLPHRASPGTAKKKRGL